MSRSKKIRAKVGTCIKCGGPLEAVRDLPLSIDERWGHLKSKKVQGCWKCKALWLVSKQLTCTVLLEEKFTTKLRKPL